MPKLLLTFDHHPTLMLRPDLVAWCTARFAALETAACGPARHNVPEDRPEAIAEAIATWADRLGLRATSSSGVPAGSR